MKKMPLSIGLILVIVMCNQAKADCIGGEVREAIDAIGVRHPFVCDKSYPKLGEAWRDPSGLIWGDVVGIGNGTQDQFIHSVEGWFAYYGGNNGWDIGAVEYCESIGARLPLYEEYVTLSNYLGKVPQVLPNLSGTILWTLSLEMEGPPEVGRRPDVVAVRGKGFNMFYSELFSMFRIRCVAK